MVCFLHAQESFICSGNYYLGITDGAVHTTVYEVKISPNSGLTIFEPINSETTGTDLNAMGYRYSDNLIYGVNTGTFELYRLGKDGVAQYLSDLPASRYLLYTAGDISPDGRYLVVIGTSSFHDRVLIFVDLDSPTFETTELWLSGPEVRCADIAFDPIDGTLYGFDGIHQKLVTIDINTGIVKSDYPSTKEALLMGGLFFDPFGNLYGYGLPPEQNFQQAYYRIDKETGTVTLETTGPTASRNDGCSCPYTVALQEIIDTTTFIPCTKVPVAINIANASKQSQGGLLLEQTFPEGFSITDIETPLDGVITISGPNNNSFSIAELEVPLGIHQVIVTIELGSTTFGEYPLQAKLSGLPKQLGELTLSDNPFTLVEPDPSLLIVGPLEVKFSKMDTQICANEGFLLDPAIPGATYLWSDGSTDPTFTIYSPGEYSLTVSSGCEIVEETILFDNFGFQIELGPNRQIDLGESLIIEPEITNRMPDVLLDWHDKTGEALCRNCNQISVDPTEDTWYYLKGTNLSGCTIIDSVFVAVEKNRSIYIPNAFTPDGDGINDQFYIQSKREETILELLIFDRWGNLLYRNTEFPTNDGVQGWDGAYQNRLVKPGVYLYKASIEFKDGITKDYMGEVAIIR